MKRTLYQLYVSFMSVTLLIIGTKTELNNDMKQSLRKIEPTQCSSQDSNTNGTCMFAANCFALNGKRIGKCIHNNYVAVCCSLAEDVGYNQLSEEYLLSRDHEKICGKNFISSRDSRIIGGQNAFKYEFPWQVALFLKSKKKKKPHFNFHCGGSLLNKNWIITAAHCVYKKDPEDFLLKLGVHDLTAEDNRYNQKTVEVSRILNHPLFNSNNFENDISLIQLKQQVSYQRNIIPICLPKFKQDLSNKKAIVSGWGKTIENGPKSKLLQKVKIPIIENKKCLNMFRKSGISENIPDPIFLCAGKEEGHVDTCEGDSGSALMTNDNDNDKKQYFVNGIVSWGIGCGTPNRPGIYTRVAHYLSWINSIIQND